MLEALLALFIIAFLALACFAYWYLYNQQEHAKVEKRSYAVAARMAVMLENVLLEDEDNVPFLKNVERLRMQEVLDDFHKI